MKKSLKIDETNPKIDKTVEIRNMLLQDVKEAKDELVDSLITEMQNHNNGNLAYEEGRRNDKYKVVFTGRNECLKYNYNKGNATGDGFLKCYRWIVLDHIKNNRLFQSYCLGLCREDLDIGTGNLHQDFTKLQMSKCCFLTNEDSVNPRPFIVEDKENFFNLHYYAFNCFPIAISGFNIKDKDGKIRSVRSDSEPWGYTNFEFEYGEEKITSAEMSSEIMDRANEDNKYDPRKVASFFLQLCAHDIKECEKAKDF